MESLAHLGSLDGHVIDISRLVVLIPAEKNGQKMEKRWQQMAKRWGLMQESAVLRIRRFHVDTCM